MSRRCRPATALLVCLVYCASGDARAEGKPDLTKTRPCGPDSIKGPLRYLLPQRFIGADFRPACALHDANYGTPYFDKGQADAQFRADTMSACDSSRFKIACRIMAMTMSRLTERYGDAAFQEAQRNAILSAR